jgi:ribose/xylose/arabinose/galactoside ABC-type transport system permease subunit
VLIALAVVALVAILMSLTVFGRRSYAIGGSPEAARIAGVRINRVRLLAFVIVGACAGLAGIILTSQAASYYPGAGTPLLLPAYTAVFLGWSASFNRSFHPLLTLFGVLFTGVLTNGLITLQVAPYVTDLVQGCVLAGAVLLARSADRTT